MPAAVRPPVFERAALRSPCLDGGLAPALWLWAERGSFPLALCEALAASMRTARVERVAAGHLVPMERPALAAEAALRLLAAAPVRGLRERGSGG
jgi:pimeloyl-ACP methyl ester carboxylesterase